MARRSLARVAAVAACALALGACGKRSEGNPNAAVPGTTGKATADAGAAPAPGVGLNGGLGTATATMGAASSPGSSTAPAGSGPDAATPGGSGSRNLTPHDAVGTR